MEEILIALQDKIGLKFDLNYPDSAADLEKLRIALALYNDLDVDELRNIQEEFDDKMVSQG